MSNETLNDFLTLKTRDGDIELFMSAALVRTIANAAGSEDNFLKIYTDNEFQKYLLEVVLVPRDDKGRPTIEDYTLEQAKIGASQQKELLQWVQEHVLDFFIGNAETAKKSMTGPRFQKLTELLSGLPTLPEQKPSAGPSTADTATS